MCHPACVDMGSRTQVVGGVPVSFVLITTMPMDGMHNQQLDQHYR